jgi:hypothetical protein
MSKWTEKMKKQGNLTPKGADLSPADQAKRITELETMLLGQLIEMTFITEGPGQELYRGTALFKSKNPNNEQPRMWPVYYTDEDLAIFNEPESFEAMLKLRVCNNLATHMVITMDWLQEVVNA